MDESGVLMAPLVRRSWALRGHPSTLLEARGKREKISLAGALWWQSGHPELHWFSQTLLNTYYDSECIAAFVEGLLAEVAGKLVLVWDGGPIHRGGPIRKLLAGQAPGLSLEPLPPYAPHLNPVEFAWSWIKFGRLCNFVPRNIHLLHRALLGELRHLSGHPTLLRGFLQASGLPAPRVLLT